MNNVATTIETGTAATLQIGSMNVGCSVLKVNRGGRQLVLVDATTGEVFTANLCKDGEYRHEGRYRVRLHRREDNRATWLD